MNKKLQLKIIMKKCVKNHRRRNLTISYLVGCLLAIIIVLGSNNSSFDSNDFRFGFYLFLFCQLFILQPLSICTVLFLYRINLLPNILDNLWLCMLYVFLPSLLMLSDAFCGNVWVHHFKNVDSLFLFALVYMLYYVATIIIAFIHRIVVRAITGSGNNKPRDCNHF